jgi:imidazolonepropionase-like amidohydrolase
MASESLIKPWKLGPQNSYIFSNANLIDPVSSNVFLNTTVRMSGGIINSVSFEDDAYVYLPSSGDIKIDLTGKYLCPGLIDNHVHISAVPGEKNLGDIYSLDPTVGLLRQGYVTQAMLRRGFTSARDCGGASLALKEAINDGVIQGPRLFIAGHALTQTGGHGDIRGAHNHDDFCSGTVMALGRLCDGVPECIKAAREELRTGADFIKIMAGGGVASPTDRLENVQFTSEEVRAISEVARNANTYVTAHAYTPRSIRHAIDNGATGIEHGNLIDEETARYMAERNVFLTPTLIAYSAMADEKHFPGFLPIESEGKNQQILQAGLRSLKIASNAGVTICYGTDLLGPLGIAQTKEFALRQQVLSPKAVLQSATINPAKRFGLSDFLGQVKKGFAADLLILNENPLKDASIFDEPDKHVLAVIKEGRVYHSRWSKLAQDALPKECIIE